MWNDPMLNRFFDRLSRNDQMRNLVTRKEVKPAAAAKRVYKDIYYI